MSDEIATYLGPKGYTILKEYLEIDANRYKLYYFGWALSSVVLVLISSKFFK